MRFYNNKMKEMRKKTQISINYITNMLHISRKTYWNWESGKTAPNEHNIRDLAKIMNIPISMISDLKEEKQKSSLSLERAISDLKPILFYKENIESSYDNIAKAILQLKTQVGQSTTLMKVLLNSNNVRLYVKDTKLKYIAVNGVFLKSLSLDTDFQYIGKMTMYSFLQKKQK